MKKQTIISCSSDMHNHRISTFRLS